MNFQFLSLPTRFSVHIDMQEGRAHLYFDQEK